MNVKYENAEAKAAAEFVVFYHNFPISAKEVATTLAEFLGNNPSTSQLDFTEFKQQANAEFTRMYYGENMMSGIEGWPSGKDEKQSYKPRAVSPSPSRASSRPRQPTSTSALQLWQMSAFDPELLPQAEFLLEEGRQDNVEFLIQVHVVDNVNYYQETLNHAIPFVNKVLNGLKGTIAGNAQYDGRNMTNAIATSASGPWNPVLLVIQWQEYTRVGSIRWDQIADSLEEAIADAGRPPKEGYIIVVIVLDAAEYEEYRDGGLIDASSLEQAALNSIAKARFRKLSPITFMVVTREKRTVRVPRGESGKETKGDTKYPTAVYEEDAISWDTAVTEHAGTYILPRRLLETVAQWLTLRGIRRFEEEQGQGSRSPLSEVKSSQPPRRDQDQPSSAESSSFDIAATTTTVIPVTTQVQTSGHERKQVPQREARETGQRRDNLALDLGIEPAMLLLMQQELATSPRLSETGVGPEEFYKWYSSHYGVREMMERVLPVKQQRSVSDPESSARLIDSGTETAAIVAPENLALYGNLQGIQSLMAERPELKPLSRKEKPKRQAENVTQILQQVSVLMEGASKETATFSPQTLSNTLNALSERTETERLLTESTLKEILDSGTFNNAETMIANLNKDRYKHLLEESQRLVHAIKRNQKSQDKAAAKTIKATSETKEFLRSFEIDFEEDVYLQWMVRSFSGQGSRTADDEQLLALFWRMAFDGQLMQRELYDKLAGTPGVLALLQSTPKPRQWTAEEKDQRRKEIKEQKIREYDDDELEELIREEEQQERDEWIDPRKLQATLFEHVDSPKWTSLVVARKETEDVIDERVVDIGRIRPVVLQRVLEHLLQWSKEEKKTPRRVDAYVPPLLEMLAMARYLATARLLSWTIGDSSTLSSDVLESLGGDERGALLVCEPSSAAPMKTWSGLTRSQVGLVVYALVSEANQDKETIGKLFGWRESYGLAPSTMAVLDFVQILTRAKDMNAHLEEVRSLIEETDDKKGAPSSYYDDVQTQIRQYRRAILAIHNSVLYASGKGIVVDVVHAVAVSTCKSELDTKKIGAVKAAMAAQKEGKEAAPSPELDELFVLYSQSFLYLVNLDYRLHRLPLWKTAYGNIPTRFKLRFSSTSITIFAALRKWTKRVWRLLCGVCRVHPVARKLLNDTKVVEALRSLRTPVPESKTRQKLPIFEGESRNIGTFERPVGQLEATQRAIDAIRQALPESSRSTLPRSECLFALAIAAAQFDAKILVDPPTVPKADEKFPDYVDAVLKSVSFTKTKEFKQKGAERKPTDELLGWQYLRAILYWFGTAKPVSAKPKMRIAFDASVQLPYPPVVATTLPALSQRTIPVDVRVVAEAGQEFVGARGSALYPMPTDATTSGCHHHLHQPQGKFTPLKVQRPGWVK